MDWQLIFTEKGQFILVFVCMYVFCVWFIPVITLPSLDERIIGNKLSISTLIKFFSIQSSVNSLRILENPAYEIVYHITAYVTVKNKIVWQQFDYIFRILQSRQRFKQLYIII